MEANFRKVVWTGVAFAALACVAAPDRAQAQFGIPGIGIRVPHIHVGPSGGSSRQGTRRSRGSSSQNDDELELVAVVAVAQRTRPGASLDRAIHEGAD